MPRPIPRLLCILLLAGIANAQIDRYELGRRVRLFERAFDAADPATRAARSLSFANAAVRSFFSMSLADAGRALTQGRRVLAGEDASSDDGGTRAFADALHLIPDARLLATAARTLGCRIRPFYRVDAEAPPGCRVELQLRRSATADDAPLAQRSFDLASARLDCALPLPATMPAGEYLLQATLRDGDRRHPIASVQVSCVNDLDARLAAVDAGVKALPPEGSRRATVQLLLDQLRALQRRRALETDLPAARLLAQAEADLQAMDQPLSRGAGEHWLALACTAAGAARESARRVVVRVEAPPGMTKQHPAPLVLALHGAGGSENLFFDGYGDGGIRPLCRRRGWLLVAPRLSLIGGAPLPALLDELARLFPFDRRQVFLIGHSMGASAAVSAACSDPTLFAGVVAFGGGGRVRQSPGLTELPFLIGIGDADFALRSARALRQTLTEAGVRRVQFKEYADVEHLLIVQVGLPDAFAFLDGIAAPR